ncbi:hypothetical protein [Mesorhizobium sp. B2-3-4]|uniref:hypothetical protein n=1 Tax=Mesorhizobium sp. B2-3-4 TaxID=2589959 RepID=UPI0011260E91|nr:hypothetical protein [Mesorhizobium sp. B2-3-4]TPM31453.1 hypothetical protein FJ967_24750 [Mesorhizobium sp. B2-3-4]
MTAAPSLLERAIVALDAPSGILDFFRPDVVRQMTVEMLKAQGCALTGDAATVERLIGHEMILVTEWLLQWEQSFTPKRRGRPELSFVQRAIYAAALYRFAGQPNAAAQAARWLGSPATKSRVEKSGKLFLRTMSIAFASRAIPKERALQATAEIVLGLQQELDRLANGLAIERTDQALRRKSARFVPFSALH